MNDLPASYGIVERDETASPVALHVERLRTLGYTVVPSGFDAAVIDDLRARLDAALVRQEAAFGAERLEAIGDRNLVRCPLAEDDAFLRLVTCAPVLEVCQALLGDYFVLMQQNGIVNPSDAGHTQRSFHRDLPYQHFVSSRPLALGALFCVDPFRRETGSTFVIPGSHKVESFPAMALAAELEVSVSADAGSYLVFDAMLFHRAGQNTSGRPRRAVNQVYTLPIIGQQISLPQALGGRYADDPVLGRLLGYATAPAASSADWRERRLRRTSEA